VSSSRAILAGAMYALFAGCTACPAIAGADAPSIRVTHRPGLPSVMDLIADSIAGRPDAGEWSNQFKLYVIGEEQSEERYPEDAPAVLGSYAAIAGGVRFTPRFPLQAGLRYRAEYRSDDSGTVSEEFQMPARPPAAATGVAAVYPTAYTLPENQLKFYLHFTAPMGRGEAYDHLRLLDGDDRDLDLPFLEIGEELWDPSGKRLTLLLDPARVKRGLKPREEQGPVLEKGRRYSLVIDRRWRDATGRPLAAEFRKRFAVGQSDESSPEPRRWQISRPAAGSREPLRVSFGEPLDQALLERMLWVADLGGTPMPGEAQIGERETSWSFTPDQAWQLGKYRLTANTLLEDLAGNSIAQKFEVERARPAPRNASEPATVEFTVRSDE
ncbi:MAG: hypothetical protein ACREJM_01425, partial [Candidatus Saccharimonadales bacterium]